MSDLGRRLIGLLIAVALAGGIAAASWPQLAAARQTGHNTLTEELVAGQRVGQTFRAPFSGLYRVDVRLATTGRQNEGYVRFHLHEGREGRELATVEVEAQEIRNDAFRRFVFEPITDSSDREYAFFLEGAGAEAGNGIAAWQTDFDSYPNGQATIDDQPADADLTFVAYYRSSPGEALRALSERVRSWHPLLWRARWLVVGAAVLWIMGLGVLLGEVLVARPRGG